MALALVRCSCARSFYRLGTADLQSIRGCLQFWRVLQRHGNRPLAVHADRYVQVGSLHFGHLYDDEFSSRYLPNDPGIPHLDPASESEVRHVSESDGLLPYTL